MGVSTDAVLFYGYCWDDEQDWTAGFSDADWRERIALKRGHTDPWDNYSKGIEKLPYAEREAAGDKWCAEHRMALDAWSRLKDSIASEFGCEIDTHCSNEYPLPLVCITGSKHSASRGYPEKIDAWPETGADWDQKLERFCQEIGIAPPEGQKPAWWLVSYWG